MGARFFPNDFLVISHLLNREAVFLSTPENAFEEVVQTREETGRRNALFTALYEAIRPLRKPEEIVSVAARLLGEHFKADRCSYADVNAEGTDATVLPDWTRGVPSIAGVHPLVSYGPEMAGELRAGRTVVLEDAERSPLTGPATAHASYMAILTRSALNVPLLKDGKLEAVFSLNCRVARYWTPGEVALAEQMAEQIRSILEAARATMALSESEGRFRRVIEQTSDGVFMAEGGGTVTYVNDAGCQLVGASREQILGMRMHDFISAGQQQELSACFERQQAGQSERRLWQVLRADGSYFTAELRFQIYSDGRSIAFMRDVAEQVKSEEQAKVILESISDAFFAVDRSWRFTYLNSQAELLLSPAPGSLLGKNMWEMFPGLIGSVFEKIYRRSADERIALSITSFYPDHGRWYEVHCYPAAAGLSIYFRDVTARKQAEEAQRHLSEQWRLALDAAQLGTWHLDPATHELTVDDRIKAIFGVEGKRLDYPTAFSIVHPEDQARVAAAIREATNPEDPRLYSDEHRIVHPDGTVRWIFSCGRANFAGEGSERHLVSLDGVASDITDRKLGEKALRDGEQRLREAHDLLEGITEGTQELIASLDANFCYTAANKAYRSEFKRLFGSEAKVGVSMIEALAHLPEDQKNAVALWGRALAGENVIATAEFGDRDRERRVFDLRFYPLRDARGAIVGAGEIASDVTERTRMVSKMEEQAAALREADRRKDEFLAMLAHELRNPLASVSTAVTLLEEESAETPNRNWAIDVIRRQSAQLARLVDDLLDVSRITRGRIELRKQLLDAATVLDHASQVTVPLIAQRGHTLRSSFPHGVLWLEADSTRLEQIVVNLLTNAAKYTEPGGQLWLEGRREGNARTGEIVLTVRDSGIGIAPEKIGQMFELFVQGERSAARSEGGLGIGLTVVRGLCELHGGSISAESAGEGAGSTFTVRLPAAAGPAKTAVVETGHRAPSGEGTGLRVLIVEDNVDTAVGLGRLLHRRGYGTELVHDGPAAVKAACTYMPDVVLLDIGLPGMDGYEVAARLRLSECCQPLIIAISGYGQDEDRLRSHRAGFDYHLVKPVDFEELQRLISENVQNRY
ncbi:MAG: luxQ 2 [Chthoniobacteraceae bacterium]|nr:luxQ 2 [Chthoniobacteraceae bacterium]